MRFRLYRKTVEESKNFTADTHYDFPEAFLDILSALTQDRYVFGCIYYEDMEQIRVNCIVTSQLHN